MIDIDFNANVSSYEDIPSSLYPVLDGSFASSVAFNHQTKPIVNGALADGNGVFFTWRYPVGDNLYTKVAVGYHFQIFEGTFSADESQSATPPGPLVFEEIVNLKTALQPENRYINLLSGASGRVDIPSGLMLPGIKYTGRVRALIFSEKGDGTVGGQYFKYTEFATALTRVNNVPAALNLRINGVSNPVAVSSKDGVVFSFTFSDNDGPAYLYGIEVGTSPGGFNIWQSGTIAGGKAFSSKDFTVPYSGQALSSGIMYYWRVSVADGMSDGGWTSGNDSFQINRDLQPYSVLVGTTTIGPISPPTVADTGETLSWTFATADFGRQRGYQLVLNAISSQSGETAGTTYEILNTGIVYSTATSIPLPVLPENYLIEAKLRLRDATELHDEFVGYFYANAKPSVRNLLVDGKENPGDVASATPIFSWKFFDSSPGDWQRKYSIQVATNDRFTSLLWDTGDVTSASTSVQYGSFGAALPLTHGSYYYVRVKVSDNFSFSDYAQAFFAVNRRPNSPTLLFPSSGAYGRPDPMLNIQWLPAVPLDPDGDIVKYTIEVTDKRSSNSNWQYLAGPLDESTSSFAWDTSSVKADKDYGVRILANDGFADSDPSLGSTSPVNGSGLGFTILNHPPETPIFISPLADSVASSMLKAEWLEADPVDVDGDAAYYVLEITNNAGDPTPTYANIGIFKQGTPRALVDVSNFPDGAAYRLRLTAYDDKGEAGTARFSQVFSVVNTPVVKDVQRLGASLYVATSDGRVMRGTEAIWQLEEGLGADDNPQLKKFVEGQPSYSFGPNGLRIRSMPGDTFIMQIGN